MSVSLMHDCYRRAWQRLGHDRARCIEIDREATPVLFFGNWQTARLATAGLNPSEDEFWTKASYSASRSPLVDGEQRFLHWEDGTLSEARLLEAFRRMEGYFTLGNAYTLWFNRYRAFLASLEMPFESGLTCHTDYASPFATKTGNSGCSSATHRLLRDYGEAVWLEVLANCPALEAVFGHGRGWRRIPDLLSQHDGWKPIATPFDHKGRTGERHLWRSRACLPNGRRIAVFWWKPNRDGAPLCFLDQAERAAVGHLICSYL